MDELTESLHAVILAAVESPAVGALAPLGVLDFTEEEAHPFTRLSFFPIQKEIIIHHPCLLTYRKKEKPSEIPSYHHNAERD